MGDGLVVVDREVELTARRRPRRRPGARAAGGTRRRPARRRPRPLDARPLRRRGRCRRPGASAWPDGALDELVGLLRQGHRAIDVLEALDQRGILVRLLPEWAAGAQPPAAQRLPPLHRRPAPVGGRGQRGRADRRVSTGPTSSCSGRCSTTSARATRAITPTPAWRWCGEIGPRLGLPRRRRRHPRADGAAPPAAARRRHPARPRPTRPRSARSPTPSATPRRWTCCTPSPRPTRWPPARRRGARGRRSSSPTSSTAPGSCLDGADLGDGGPAPLPRPVDAVVDGRRRSSTCAPSRRRRPTGDEAGHGADHRGVHRRCRARSPASPACCRCAASTC